MKISKLRTIRQAVFSMYKDPQEGDLLMDVPSSSTWHELRTYALNKEYWRERVNQENEVAKDLGSDRIAH